MLGAPCTHWVCIWFSNISQRKFQNNIMSPSTLVFNSNEPTCLLDFGMKPAITVWFCYWKDTNENKEETNEAQERHTSSFSWNNGFRTGFLFPVKIKTDSGMRWSRPLADPTTLVDRVRAFNDHFNASTREIFSRGEGLRRGEGTNSGWKQLYVVWMLLNCLSVSRIINMWGVLVLKSVKFWLRCSI